MKTPNTEVGKFVEEFIRTHVKAVVAKKERADKQGRTYVVIREAHQRPFLIALAEAFGVDLSEIPNALPASKKAAKSGPTKAKTSSKKAAHKKEKAGELALPKPKAARKASSGPRTKSAGTKTASGSERSAA